MSAFVRDPLTTRLIYRGCVGDSGVLGCLEAPGMDAVSDLALSPDGKSLIAGSVEDQIVNLDVTPEPPVPPVIPDHPLAPPPDTAIAPSGVDVKILGGSRSSPRVRLSITAGEAIEVKARGKIEVGSTVANLAPAAFRAESPGATVRAVLKPRGRSRALGRAIRDGKRMRARLEITLRDEAGNAEVLTRRASRRRR